MRSFGITLFMLLALSAAVSADIITPANAGQMDDSVSWATLGTGGSVNSQNGVTLTLQGSATDAVTIDLGTAVSGVGLLAQPADSAANGQFTISAWGIADNLLGSETVSALTGSSVFAGLIDNTGAHIFSFSIDYVDSASSTESAAFDINTVLLSDLSQAPASGLGVVTSDVGHPSPEPASIFLCGSAIAAGLALLRLRRAN